MVVVLVDPWWQGGEAGGFGAIERLEGPSLDQGAVEAFDLAVGLWSVGRVRFGVMPSSVQVSRHSCDRWQLPFSLSTRCTVTPRSANQATALRRTWLAVSLVSSSRAST